MQEEGAPSSCIRRLIASFLTNTVHEMAVLPPFCSSYHDKSETPLWQTGTENTRFPRWQGDIRLDNNSAHPIRETFVLRLWRDASGKRGLRGQIQHVHSKQTTAIRDLANLLEYLERYFKEEAPSQTGDETPGKSGLK